MLDRIIGVKEEELEAARQRISFEQLMMKRREDDPPLLSSALGEDAVNIIAEIKYRSPSRGESSCKAAPRELARLYCEGGAAAVSVLTDRTFFGGSLENLELVRGSFPDLPLLRKDFILDRYQVVEASVHGASAFLLIVACLGQGRLEELIRFGQELGLEPLVEVHDSFELERAIDSGASLIGVNNRNLKTFEVSLQTSFDLARRLEGESGFRLVSESGISERSQILELKSAGFHGFLIGTSLMDAVDPVALLRSLRGKV